LAPTDSAFKNMSSALDPSIHEYVDSITYCIDDFGELVE
jgi:hypothetical protein